MSSSADLQVVVGAANAPDGVGRADVERRSALVLSGEIDFLSADMALAKLLVLPVDEGDDVVVDVGDVTFIDSRGVSMLLVAREHFRGRGCRLVLSNVTRPVQRVLALLGVAAHFAAAKGMADGAADLLTLDEVPIVAPSMVPSATDLPDDAAGGPSQCVAS